MDKANFNQSLVTFLSASPSPFHAVANMQSALLEAGFVQLHEANSWSLELGGQYFVVRNDSSIIAFRMGKTGPVDSGFRMVGAHTDSPALKVKPNPEMNAKSYNQLAVEVYGGVLLNPWFDRDLSLAGRVTLRDSEGKLHHELINFENAIAIIPSLAIHLDREANDMHKINKQTDLPPILSLASGQTFSLLEELQQLLTKKGEVLDYELYFYDTQAAAMIGLRSEFLASARLDNLLSCYTGLRAMLASDPEQAQLLVCNDHEEVGSGSTSGARGNFLRSVLERIAETDENNARMIARSMMISTDNAHGVHPNFADKHDERHGPILNAGPVIKINSNQAYASNSETVAIYKHVADLAGTPYQLFVTRSDMGCGSTIGPITATVIGVRTIDIGVPTFAMHSIRELAGSDDAYALFSTLQQFNTLVSLDVAPA